MRFKRILFLALILNGAVFGCSTATPRAVVTDSKKAEFPYQKINGFPYETKPVLLSSRGLFWWFVSADLKQVFYEPCIGHYDVALVGHSKTKLTFKIINSHGHPIDLLYGDEVAASKMIGKEYSAKLEGDHIVSVSEIK